QARAAAREHRDRALGQEHRRAAARPVGESAAGGGFAAGCPIARATSGWQSEFPGAKLHVTVVPQASVCLALHDKDLVLLRAVTYGPAAAAADYLDRDGALTSAYVYGYSDGGEEYPGEEPGRWDLGGPFSLLAGTTPLQQLVFGPTFRNE